MSAVVSLATVTRNADEAWPRNAENRWLYQTLIAKRDGGDMHH